MSALFTPPVISGKWHHLCRSPHSSLNIWTMKTYNGPIKSCWPSDSACMLGFLKNSRFKASECEKKRSLESKISKKKLKGKWQKNVMKTRNRDTTFDRSIKQGNSETMLSLVWPKIRSRRCRKTKTISIFMFFCQNYVLYGKYYVRYSKYQGHVASDPVALHSVVETLTHVRMMT